MELTRTKTVDEYGDVTAKYRIWAFNPGHTEYFYCASVSDAIALMVDHDKFTGYMAAGFEENINHGSSAVPDWCEWYDEETGEDIDEFMDRDFDEEGD